MSVPNVLATRYAGADLAEIWSPEHKIVLERQLWVAVLKAQRDLAYKKLNEIDGVVCPEPQGAFYVYPSVKGLLGRSIGGRTANSSVELPELILELAEVAVVPGEAFGTRATCGCPTRSGTRTWSRASPGCSGCSRAPTNRRAARRPRRS